MGFGNRMIQLIGAVAATYHLDFLELPDRRRYGHVLLLALKPDHLFFEKVIDPVANDQSNKLYKDLRGHTL